MFVLSEKQIFELIEAAAILVVRGPFGKSRIYCQGQLAPVEPSGDIRNPLG